MKSESLEVLVPLDGSPPAESILPALLPLATRKPVVLNLLQVIDCTDELEAARVYLHRTKCDVERDRVEAISRIEFGHPVDEILHLAEPEKVDLVAMTTHGRSGLRRAFLGSVAEGVLRQAKVPLLLNRPGIKIGDWHRMVVPVDGSVISEAILEEAGALALLVGATVHVVRVSLPILPTADLYFRTPPEESEDPEPYLGEICNRLAKQGVLAVPMVLKGFAGQEIVKYAKETSAGLIAMMTQGRGGVSRLLTGSVAEEILRGAPCPVFVRRWAPVESTAPRAVRQ